MSESGRLVLVYEPEAACVARLAAAGIADRHAAEIASYLAQSTDLAAEFVAIAEACRTCGMDFDPLPLDSAPAVLPGLDPRSTLVWTLTDGIAYFRGAAAPSLAALAGIPLFGADFSLAALCQDKFRSGAVLAALGLPVPPAGLARNGRFVIAPPPSPDGYFVKPNRLGAKIGIWKESRCRTKAEAQDLSRRVFDAYRDDVVVQPYIAGRNVRASFLAVAPEAGPERLGVVYVDSGGDFQTMAESLDLYGGTGAEARAEERYAEPVLQPVAADRPDADAAIRAIAARLMDGLGLADVFSLDFRVGEDGAVHLIEFEICPGLPCFDFRAYCASEWRLSLPKAMAVAAANRLPKALD